MRAALLVVIALVACSTGAPAPIAAPKQIEPTAPPPALPPPAPPTKEQIVESSHVVLAAFDHGETAKLETMWSARLIRFDNGHRSTRDEMMARLAKRKPGPPYIKERTWTDETVQLGPDDAVFIGKATEVQGGNDSHGGYKYVGWYTLQWVREGADWKLRLWTWQRGGAGSKSDGWNEIFRGDSGFEKQPNKLMVEVVKPLKPGTALDLAMGQGRNALWLAEQGWKTTGVDFAEDGLKIARAEATRRKLTLTTINANIDEWDFGKEKWDLITMIYPGDNHEPWIEKSKVALKKNGLFVLEFFAGDPADPDEGGYMPGQLAKAFSGPEFVILRDDTVEGQPDWATDHARLVRFVAKKK